VHACQDKDPAAILGARSQQPTAKSSQPSKRTTIAKTGQNTGFALARNAVPSMQ